MADLIDRYLALLRKSISCGAEFHADKTPLSPLQSQAKKAKRKVERRLFFALEKTGAVVHDGWRWTHWGSTGMRNQVPHREVAGKVATETLVPEGH